MWIINESRCISPAVEFTDCSLIFAGFGFSSQSTISVLFMSFFTPPVFHSITQQFVHLSTKHLLKFPNGLNHRLTARFDFSNWTQEGGADNPAACSLPDQPTSESLHRDILLPTVIILLSPFETKCFHDWCFLIFFLPFLHPPLLLIQKMGRFPLRVPVQPYRAEWYFTSKKFQNCKSSLRDVDAKAENHWKTYTLINKSHTLYFRATSPLAVFCEWKSII